MLILKFKRYSSLILVVVFALTVVTIVVIVVADRAVGAVRATICRQNAVAVLVAVRVGSARVRRLVAVERGGQVGLVSSGVERGVETALKQNGRVIVVLARVQIAVIVIVDGVNTFRKDFSAQTWRRMMFRGRLAWWVQVDGYKQVTMVLRMGRNRDRRRLALLLLLLHVDIVDKPIRLLLDAQPVLTNASGIGAELTD